MYVLRNTEARSSNNPYSGKAISITYSGYVYVVLVIHAHVLYYFVICDQSCSIIFFDIVP
jgi:hypothetical protein